MITLPYPTAALARQSRVNAGWHQLPGGRYGHAGAPGAVARIDGCNVIIERAPTVLTEVIAEIENHAALREEGEFDRSRQGGK